MRTVTEQPEWTAAFVGYVTSVHPTVWGRNLVRNFTIMGPVQPCERCGEPIVLLRSHDDASVVTWCHVGAVYTIHHAPYVQMHEHAPDWCQQHRDEVLS
jgi:uncharacterized protein (DUF983 family)